MPFTVPLPYRILIVVVLVVATFVAGALVGVDWESARHSREDLAQASKVIERTRRITIADNKGLAKLQQENDALRHDNDRLQQEVMNHAKTIPDPPGCFLDPRRVCTIRAAWGTVDPDCRDGEGGLRGPEGGPAPEIGKPRRLRGVGDAVGPQVPGVPQQ